MRNIVYPYFLETSLNLNDVFWRNVFEDLAYGVPPAGAYITTKNVQTTNKDGIKSIQSSDYLCCGLKDKEFNWKIERKNKEQLYKELYDIFTKKLGIFSDNEKYAKEIEFHNHEKELSITQSAWSTTNKKHIRHTKIENFALDMKKQYDLKPKDVKFLISCIHLGIIFKSITTKDIHDKDGRIQQIDGIEINPDNAGNKICITKELFKPTSSTETKRVKKTIRSLWDKHMLSLLKII